MGNRVNETVVDPSNVLSQQRRRVFDSLNRLAKEIGAQNQVTAFSYDANGNLTGITDPLANTTTRGYDALNRLVQVTDPAGGTSRYGFDANDQLTSVTDPRSLTTAYDYDGLGDLARTISPDSGNTTNTHDAAGNLLSKTDARGLTTRYSYDSLNRLTQTLLADGSSVVYHYDNAVNAIGRLVSMTDATGTTGWSYDAQGRVMSKQQQVNRHPQALGYRYNSAGQLAGLTYPSGATLDYRYTQGKITDVILNNTQTLLTHVHYQPFGPVSGWTWGNGLVYDRDFDQDGRLTAFPLAANTHQISYDLSGRITQLASPAATQLFNYDALDRLTRYSQGSALENYGYDALGNRVSVSSNTGSSLYHYSANSNHLSSIQGANAKTYGYDAAGNLINDGTRQFTYDSLGRLTLVTEGRTQAVYELNGLGQRVAKNTKQFFYDEQGHLVGEYTATGRLIQEIVYLGDTPIAVIRPRAVYYVYADHLDTPRSITTDTNTVVWTWQSDPFGTTLANGNPDGNGKAFTFNLRFPGQYYDDETGLHYNWFRFYEPKTGRYISSDPIGLAGGLNTYAYVGSNPINGVDPLGLRTCLLTTVGPLGIRDHAAIYTSQGNGSGGPTLYDPAGSYAYSKGGGSGDLVTGSDASIENFTKYHKGQTVESTCKDTSRKEEEAIIKAAENLPSASPFQCAERSSTALRGQPSFPHVEAGTFWPGILKGRVERK